MARFLHRVGSVSHRHRWLVIVTWLVLLAGTSVAAAAFKVPLGNEFRIPGAGFQKVMDTLKAQIPAASGDSSTILVTSTSGFTAGQEAAVAAATTRWARIGGVSSAVDPFATQARLDATAGTLTAGRTRVEAARAQLTQGESKLATAAAQLDAGQRALDRQKAALPAGTPLPAPLAAAQQRLDGGRATLTAQKGQLVTGRATLARQEKELALGERTAALTRGIRLVAPDRRAALVQVHFAGHASALTTADRDAIRRTGDELERSGVRVDYSSDIVGGLDSILGATEILGVVVAAVVLLVMLGTLIAAGLPLLMALVGVAAGIGGTLALSDLVQMNSITPVLGLMLGLAVGIDYSLFIINRHRTQLLAGMPAAESIPRANGTSGNAVVFAGLTVVIALAALSIVGIPFLRVMGLTAAATVAVAVVVAITLTPAVLAVVGHRVLSRRAWQRHGFTPTGTSQDPSLHLTDADAGTAADPDADAGGDAEAAGAARRPRWPGWAEIVTGRPWAAALGCLVMLGLAAIPSMDLRLGLPDGGSEPKGSTAQRTYTLTARFFGEGANGPLVAVATLPAGMDAVTVQEKALDVAERLAAVPHVVRALPIGVSADRRVVAVQIVPERGPGAEQTVHVVDALRAAGPGVRAATGADLGLTGQTVANIDISAKLSDALAPYLAVVVGLSLIILVMVFRSLIVPLVATGGFLLSVGAAFGAVVAVYQWGWLADVFGVSNPEAVLSFLPTLLIGVLFGLAMDYQMFLVSGMREAFVHGQDARRAVRTGFHHGRRVVAAAALIMISVFAGFVFADLTMIRPIGFGLAVGVAVDAFVVRMTLTPAVMHLLGRRAWWIPRWLDRIVPDVDVEGAALTRPRPAGGPAGPDAAGGADTPVEHDPDGETAARV